MLIHFHDCFKLTLFLAEYPPVLLFRFLFFLQLHRDILKLFYRRSVVLLYIPGIDFIQLLLQFLISIIVKVEFILNLINLYSLDYILFMNFIMQLLDVNRFDVE
jgi:hypothetical protein